MFKTVTVEAAASIGDAFRRNYIMTSNEIRKIVGLKPSNDARADELFNPNIGDDKQLNKGMANVPSPKAELPPPPKESDEV